MNLPSIGSRVRRGPNWMWQQQDEDRAGNQTFGTVVAHMNRNRFTVCVKWDGGYQNQYRYVDGCQDVVPLKSDKIFEDFL
jgi:Mib_herc2